jgi:hypothetical protein
MTACELLIGGYRMGSRMLRLMCEDLTEPEFHHQPVPGANSVAWIVGHLAVTARRTAERLGATELPVLTEDFVGRYSQSKKPAEVQSDLGSKEELLSLFTLCTDKLTEALRTLPADGLDGPALNPGRFANNYGEAILFGSLHFAMHCGQISTIRRSLGKPPQL